MIKGHYFLWLPLLYSIVIPGLLLYNALTVNSSLFHWALIAIAGCLTFLNLALFLQFFNNNAINSEKLDSALRGKDLLNKIVIIFVIITLVSGISLGILDNYNSKVIDEHKILNQSYDLNRIFFFSFYSMIISLWVPTLFVIRINYNFNLRKTYAYFLIGLNKKDLSDKINYYQKGIESYNKFLSEMFGKKLTRIEEIESHLLSENIEKTDVEIRLALNELDEPLQIAKRLDSWTRMSESEITNITNTNDIFKTKQPYENLEKWFKITGIVISSIIGLIVILVTKVIAP